MQVILTRSIRTEAFHPALGSPADLTEMLFGNNMYRAQGLLVNGLQHSAQHNLSQLRSSLMN